ncbi:hypothetical protein [Rhizobium sp. P007]|uniref:hypothetical protein n=1 Tax=Rhizobium phage RR1-A TaxID=929833 RepID=UPI0003427904|nr:hypothetical protein [Rhizobium sp. P007]YP_008130172.1 hypothetical protein RHXG_00025 [Rhizobium phage RR1-A]AGN34401.1 hypothetical protein RHXG_00025 [Rhizobium phage RR1-A]CAD7058676.1 hypothetical protein RP007_02681 [Rhizobium sp. P007]HAU74606.1 hypothetical protein [Agrobacterium sp.]
MFAVLNTSGVVCALRETDDPIADVFTIVAVDAGKPPSVGDIGSHKSDGSWDFKPTKSDISLDDLKSALKIRIDAAAEAERLKYITSGAGQALTYMQKSDEARRYLAADEPDADDYPLLSAEVGITAPDIHGVAVIVSAAFSQWQQIGAAIEAARLGGKASIETSETAANAQAAFDSIAWPAV